MMRRMKRRSLANPFASGFIHCGAARGAAFVHYQSPKPMEASPVLELAIILYAMVLATTAALFLFRWDIIEALIKFLCGDDDNDDRGGGKLIPAYAKQRS
jgi:hypothetical protein